ncbi:MAG: virulence RhuM family protein [Bacteroidales bacterium]|nr:virulence RhuM family protein [Bacteroidales bacterium]
MVKSEIIMYQGDNTVAVEVRLENENVWLNRQQIALLFDRDIKTIGKHIGNALKEELAEFSTVANFATVEGKKNANSVVAKFATTAANGKVYQMEHYNLDMILSVGYRVKSNRGVQFRIWANHVLKNYLLKGYAVHKRFERLENRVAKTEEKIDFFVKTSLPPLQGIFFEGEIFDAYIFISKLIKSAKKSIVLIDNYIDETVLTLLSKRQAKVSAQIYTKRISTQLQLDLKKHNSQYAPININTSNSFHDRFLIIDNTVYHIGASIKDLGKKLFAFSKMEINYTELSKII